MKHVNYAHRFVGSTNRQIEIKKLSRMNIPINTIESFIKIPEYMTAEEINSATTDNE